MGKRRAVTESIDQRIYDLIHDLLHLKSEDLKHIRKGNDDPFSLIAMAKDLKIHEVLSFVQLKDFQMRRMKSKQLEKSIDAVLNIVREDERKELAEMSIKTETSDDADSEFEGVDINNLMEVKDSNDLNKSVISLWSNNNDGKVGTQEVDKNNAIDGKDSSQHTEDEEKKTKKRSKDSTVHTVKKHKKKIEYETPSITLSSLGGLELITTQLMEMIGLPILHPEIYLSTGVEPPRGILLYGPPGCGKTTVANAFAGELKVPFINISAPSVVSGMSGESEKKLREIFEEAKNLAPCIIFIDEIDAITPKRDGGAQREMEKRIVAQLLTLMDELSLEKTNGKPVAVIGATNRPDSLDSALRRAGRFDREIRLNVPSEEQRASILKSMTSKLKLEGDFFNYRELAKLTPGYVGADLKSLVSAAGLAAIKRIFESMSERDEKNINSEGFMDVDAISADQGSKNNNVINVQELPVDQKVFENRPDQEKLSIIYRFLEKHPQPLTEEQLAPLAISYADFLTALPSIQPTAKREGFSTVPDVTWQSVGALTKIRMELHMCIVQPIKKPELFSKVGITSPGGVLMWGPPGCGKTLLAKAVANESRANFISIKGPELLNKYVGESERAVRQVFSRARASEPCIIFFDELDALVPRRDTSMSESSSRVVNTLLTELDGLNDRKGVYVIGATNRPDMIDPAMRRPGRLDKTLYIELPTSDERLEILRTLVNSNKTPLDSLVNLSSIAHDERCRNYSGADLSSLLREAGVMALKKKFFKKHEIKELDESGFYEESETDVNVVVTQEDFEMALSSIAPSVTDKDRSRYDRLNKRIGWTTSADGTDGSDQANSNVA